MAEPIDSFDEEVASETWHPEVHFSDYWAVVVKHRRLIIAFVIVAFVAGVLTTVLSRPMYRATTSLDIVRQPTNPLGFAVVGQEGVGTDAEFLPSQLQLLQSREVGERAVRQLNLLANPEFNPKSFRSFAPKPGGAGRVPTAEDVADAAESIRSRADATIVRGTTLVEISYAAPSAKLAADVANGIADAYVEWNIESRFKMIGQSSQFLAGQIEQAKRDLDAKEKELLAYGRLKDIVSVDPQTNSTMQKLESINRDYVATVTERVAKEARYQELRNAPAETVAEAASGGVVAQLRSEQARLEREYSEKLNLYKPEWPAMQQLKKQVEDGRQHLEAMIPEVAAKALDAARSDYLTALRRETNLQAMMRSQQSEALIFGGNAVEYKNLRVEIETKRALLDNLLRQQGETEVLGRLREQKMTNIRVVDRALPPGSPFKPSFRTNVALALLLGAVLGVGLAFFLSYLDRSLRTSEQVERYLGLPALGVVPMIGTVARVYRLGRFQKTESATSAEENKTVSIELLPQVEPRSTIAEAYRAFRTSLLLSRAGGVKLLIITSAMPQEGKTATAINLALSLGQLGRRVLLVDADLHRSRIHEVTGISNRVGLVSVLAEGVEPSRAIVKTAMSGVWVVPAGPETPNPSGLLSSDAMRKFLELAATNFDHVVVDTPPVLMVSDALVFGQYTDGVVLCVRAGKTPRDQVRRVRDRLLRSGVPILGVLINGVEIDSGYYPEYQKPYAPYGGERPAPAGEEQPPGPQASQVS